MTREAAARMPAALAALGEPWGKFLAFEEDAIYGAVVLAWPGWFPPATVEAARAGLRRFYLSHVDGGSGCGRETDRGSFHRCPR